MGKALVILAIGPVQNFIAKARKTSDLYSGSRLLSDLMEKAIQILKEQQGLKVEIIYPGETLKSKPNRLLALVETEDSLENLNNPCYEFKKGLNKELVFIARNLLQKLEIQEPSGYQRQLENFLEVYWAISPLEDKSYHQGFVQVNRLMDAVKNTRIFEQLAEDLPYPVLGETGRKCTICGEFNLLFYSDKDYKTDTVNSKTGLKGKYISSAAKNIYQNLKIKGISIILSEKEGLCAVCFLKRFYRYDTPASSFGSTAEIALLDTLDKLKNQEETRIQLDRFKNLFGLYFDETLYYKENLTAEYFKKWGYPLEYLECAQRKLEGFYRQAKIKVLKFAKYYAVLALDGDDMGKWLSGENLIDRGELFDFHKNLTHSLGEYARHSYEILKPPRGQLVYAGGDDLLGFVNLNYLPDVLSELRSRFPAFEQLAQVSPNKKSSASMGLAVAHYKTPLSEVLTVSRRMLAKAKNQYNKNSLAIAILKRSGETVEVSYNFETGEIDSSYLALKSLKSVIDEISKGRFSKSFINNLRAEFMPLLDQDGNYPEEHLLIEEIKRLVDCSCMLVKKPSESKEDFKKRKTEAIGSFQKQLIDLLYGGFSGGSSIRDYFNFLDMAVFIGKEVNHDR